MGDLSDSRVPIARRRFVEEFMALVPGVLYVVDAITRRAVYVNHRTSEAIGYSEAEIDALGDAFLAEVLHPGDAEVLDRHFARLRLLDEGQTLTVQYRFRRSDGAWRWFESHDAVFLRGGDGAVSQVIGIATDITERKRSEDEAHASSARQRFRSDLADALQSTDDAETIERLAASMLSTHLGARHALPGELSGTAELEARSADDQHVVRPGSWDAGEQALIDEVEQRTRTAIAQAATRRALRESEARYRTLFTSIDEGFCVCEMIVDNAGSPVDYRFLEVNERFESQTGLVDAVGRTALELVPELEQHWIEMYGRVGLGGETVRFEQGSEAMGRWFDVYSAPVEPSGSGRFVIVFSDCTDRKHAELSLRQSEERERRARRRAELTTKVILELERVEGQRARACRLLELLVPRVADYGVVELPGGEAPILASRHVDPVLASKLEACHREVAAAPGRTMPPFRPHARSENVDTSTARAVSEFETFDPHSEVVAVLDLGGRLRGMLVLGLSDPARSPYDDGDSAFLHDLARQVSVTLASARVREAEHDIAVRLQRALLPETIAQPDRLTIAARYRAAHEQLEVGGDWYDALALGDSRVALVVGDVVGHGLEAAASMGRLRIALAALAPYSDSPSDLLSRLDSFAAGPDGAPFATACLAIVDTRTGTLAYASAGHPPMLVVSTDGHVRWLEGGRSVPLAVIDDAHRSDGSEVLAPGELVILYSDGLVERRGVSLGAGFERLAQVARTVSACAVEQACDIVIASMEEFAGGYRDDVVVVCARLLA